MRPSYAQRAEKRAQRVRYALYSPCAAHCRYDGGHASHSPCVPCTQEGPGALKRRGLSSPVLTRSPELSGSFPSDRLPRAARLPQKISPRQRGSILERGHSYEGCCTPRARFRIQVR
jgi:hypothetical protein